MSTVSNRTRAWQESDARHHLHPFMSHPELAAKGARVITHADGVYIYDSEGHKILDGMAGLWCIQVGYGNEELIEAGSKALRELPYYNTFFKTTHPYVVELAEAIASVTPEGLDRMHFCNSGSEANDTGLKLVRYYNNLMGRPNKKHIISRRNAYHGSTIAAASLTGLQFMHPQFDLPIDKIHHVEPCPFWYRFGGDMTEEEFGLHCAKAIEDKILELGPENVAAFIGEPVMGATGMFPPPANYWKEVERICRKYDVLLWVDEVICGFGRTGEWFGSQYYGITPDMMTVAKGLSSGYQPISAIIFNEKVGGVIAAGEDEMAHGMTYSGHPVCAAVALKNIEILKRDIVNDAGRKRAAYFQRQLRTLEDHPIVGQVRGLGFLGGLELVKDKATRTYFPSEMGVGGICRDHCFNNDFIMRASGDSMILSPPLVISEAEIDELVAKARLCLDLTAKQIGVM